MRKYIDIIVLISLGISTINSVKDNLVTTGLRLQAQDLEKMSYLEAYESKRGLLLQDQKTENEALSSVDMDTAMCDLSASLKVPDYSSTWQCTNDVPDTDICTGWTGVTCTDSVVTRIFVNSASLSGTISSSIGYLTTLTYIWLGTNNIIGTIPSAFGYLNSLTFLNLGTNKITGTIPPQLGSLTNLVNLYLDNDKLTGTVPSELCVITSFNALAIYNTLLTCYSSCLSSVSGKDYGSVTPCTSTPTTVPSSSPTSKPTAKPTATPTNAPSSVPTTIPTLAPTKVGCPITVRLYDKFGDGWNNAYLLATNTDYIGGYGVSTTYGISSSIMNGYAPAVDNTFATLSLIIGNGEVSTLSIKSLESIKTINEWWEIQWSYSLRGQTYRGNIDTVISLSCDWESLSEYDIKVINTNSLLSADTCKSCIDENKGSSATLEKKKPNPRNLLSLPKVSLKPVVSSSEELPIMLYTDDGSLYYSISDSDRVTLIVEENFCELSREEKCQESLKDGQYIFRVSGGDSGISGDSWKFCGLKGGVPSEVAFSWEEGKCTVLQIDADSVSSEDSMDNVNEEEDSMLPLLSAVSILTSSWGFTLLIGVAAITLIIGILGLRSYFPSVTSESIDATTRSTTPLFTYPSHKDTKIAMIDSNVLTEMKMEN